MFGEIEAGELVENFHSFTLIDIRSPSEYKEFHIPGAFNVPLFNDEEKKLIGEIYRLKGQEVAKEEGLKIVSPKLYEFYMKFKELQKHGRPIVVYCWRGGLRSIAMCSFISGMGIKVLRLKGGYRAFRKYILEGIAKLLENKSFLVITGRTGVGKTKILRILKSEGLPVIDLEDLAKDRGSVFGKIGIKDAINQKMFDTFLFFKLMEIKENLIIIEDESRRIGNIHLPSELVKKMSKGVRVEINTTIENRVNIILEEYLKNINLSQLRSSLYKISKYINNETLEYLLNLLENGYYKEVAEFLMNNYYDRKYKKIKNNDFYIFYKNIDFAIENIKRIFVSSCNA